jgi:uridine phosphorylase
MNLPILEFDPNREALLNPAKLIKTHPEMPVSCVLCFFHDVIRHLGEQGLLKEITSLRSEMGKHPVYRFTTPHGDVALAHPGIGSPLAAGMMEETIALGARQFIACGGAGVLDSSPVGSVLVPTAAVRDEGTSYHYLPPSREVVLQADVVKVIGATLSERAVSHRLVKTWTTDAFYRETPARMAARRAEGCACVEMETAALSAVAQFRGVKFGQLLYGGDDLGGAQWDDRDWHGQWNVREKLTFLAAEIAVRLTAMAVLSSGMAQPERGYLQDDASERKEENP